MPIYAYTRPVGPGVVNRSPEELRGAPLMEFTRGDIFAAGASALVNPVNCVGVMGAGLAREVRYRYPEVFKPYADACRASANDPGRLQPGQLHLHDRGANNTPRYIVNFPTKRHWREASRLVDIERGLVCLWSVVAELRIQTIAIPALGCGLGGLPWRDVRQLLVTTFAASADTLAGSGALVSVYEPN